MTTSYTALKPLRPTLYRLAQDGCSLDFIYVQCSACGGLTFPANAPGCMHCGDP
ncbi:MAG TPA: zinc ribbon domain-containing protein, partial [Rhodoferax sp.]